MKNFLLAIQFLTIIPVKTRHFNERELAKAIIYFPLVGLLLGLILIGTNNILLFLGFGQWAVSIILVILLIMLTRGLHLDGLADTSDALLSGKSRSEMLEIMRDPRIGAMGVLSLISVILLKAAFLWSINTNLIMPSLLLMCILSRWSMVMSMFLFPYARQEGKAKDFIRGINPKVFIFSTLITLSCVLLIWNLMGISLMLIAAANAYLFGIFIKKKLGGITGDTIGATNELIEIVILLTICITGRLI